MDLTNLQDAFKNSGSPEDFPMEGSSFSTPMLGDFYREPDDVCRGLTLPGASGTEGLPMDLPMDGCFALKGADYYTTPDVVRGVTLDAGFQQYGLGTDFTAPPPLGFDYGMDAKPMFSQQTTVQNGERFEQGDLAFPKPIDPLFTFSQTSLDVLCQRADVLMNVFYDFLTTMVVSEITKVNRRKCCIKANVFVDNVMCTVKARGYQMEPGTIKLEIMKRSGDAITFCGVFRKAAQHLQDQSLFAGYQITSGLPQDPVGLGLAAPPLPKGKVDVQDYAPLLDMASQSHMPDLQAEAAGALASSTADPEVADALSSDEMAMQDIAMLLETDRLDIALPASELVTNLARSPKAPEHFEGMLVNLVRTVQRYPVKTNSRDASYEAKRRFAEALATATASCRQRLSEPSAGQLAQDLHAVMTASKDSMGNPDAAFGNLQTAYFNLMPQAIPA